MNIIFSNYDSPNNPYYGGGGANSIQRIAQGLVKAKQNVTILSGAFPGSVDETLGGVKYQYIGIGSLAKINQLLFLIILPYYVLTSHFDVWIESFIPPFSTTFVPLWTRKKVVGFAQLLNAKEFSQKYWGIPFHYVQNIAIKNYHHIIVLTESLKKVVAAINLNCRVEVLGLGYDKPSKIYPKSVADKFYLYMGRIDIFQKGIDILLSAYSSTPVSTPRLMIAGGGSTSDINKLNKLISKYKLSNRVTYLGKISGIKKAKILSGAIATIIPSRYETFCLSALESIGHGTHVIVSDIPDLDWIPAIAKRTFKITKQKDLSELLVNLPYNKFIKKTKASDYQASVSEYEWDKVIKRYVDYIIGIKNV